LGSIAYNEGQQPSGYEPFNLTELNPTGVNQIATDIDNGTTLTIVVTPGDKDATATWAGSVNAVTDESPILRVDYSQTLPSWVSAANTGSVSNALWIEPTQNLVINGATSIVADPGSAEPVIDASGSVAVVTVDPADTGSATDIHIGGVNLSDGAAIDVTSLGATRSLTDYHLVILGTSTATAAPAFNIDASSSFDLADNDMAILYGSGTSPISTVQSEIGSAYAGGSWTGSGLTSSVAKTSGGITALGYGEASTLVADGETSFDGLSLTGLHAVMIKFTLVGDTQLTGNVGLADSNKVISNLNDSGEQWTDGSFDYTGNVGLGSYNDVLKNFNNTLANVLPGGSGNSATVPPAKTTTTGKKPKKS